MIDRTELYDKALIIRQKLGEDFESPIDLFKIVQTIKNLTLVRFDMGDNISGLCIKSEKSAVIAVNTNCSKGRQNFTLAHELYHYYFSDELTTTICSFSNLKNEEEKKADIFASYLLLTGIALRKRFTDWDNRQERLHKIIETEQMYGLSHQALLIRLIQDGYLKEADKEKYEKNIIQKAESMGYEKTLYEKTNTTGTYGYYIEKVNELYKKQMISEDKKDEFLFDCMREDLIDGVKEESIEYIVD